MEKIYNVFYEFCKGGEDILELIADYLLEILDMNENNNEK